MIGNGNELRVNGATMCEIVQGWVDENIRLGSPQVKSVGWSASPDSVFIIKLEAKPETTIT